LADGGFFSFANIEKLAANRATTKDLNQVITMAMASWLGK